MSTPDHGLGFMHQTANLLPQAIKKKHRSAHQGQHFLDNQWQNKRPPHVREHSLVHRLLS